MKKIVIVLLLVAAILAGCGSQSEARQPYTVQRDGATLTIDPQEGTITDGDNTYTYAVSENGVLIGYPNGLYYRQNYVRSEDGVSTMVSGGWSSNDPELISEAENHYIPGDILADVVDDEMPEPEKSFPVGLLLCALVLGGLGVWHLMDPDRFAYYLFARWVKGGEPSDQALYMVMGQGIIMILSAIIVLVMCFLF